MAWALIIRLQKNPKNIKSLLPIYILKLKGNEANDFLPFARAAKLFYPDCLETSYSNLIILSLNLKI